MLINHSNFRFDDGVSSPPDPPPASVPTPDSSTSTPTSTTPSGPGSSSQAHSSSAASSESSGSLTSNIGLKTGVSGPSVITSFVPVSATGGPQPDSNSNQTITGNSAAAGTSTSHFPVAIVVAVACAVVALALVAFALLWCRRRKQTAPRKSFLVDPDPKTHGSAHASLVYSAQTSQMGHSTQSLVSNAYSTQSLVSNARPLESSVPSSHGTTWEGSSYGPSESSVSSSQWTEEVAQPRPHASGSRPEMRPPSYSPQDPSRPALDSTPSLGGKYQLSVEGGRIVEEP
ncbi:hypothetical protein B0H19DRAFT_309787 [Mycena capillaripes]|nr:hypothetical protein B0H19DRAFT_309787 [Mycena capillaripes]